MAAAAASLSSQFTVPVFGAKRQYENNEKEEEDTQNPFKRTAIHLPAYCCTNPLTKRCERLTPQEQKEQKTDKCFSLKSQCETQCQPPLPDSLLQLVMSYDESTDFAKASDIKYGEDFASFTQAELQASHRITILLKSLEGTTSTDGEDYVSGGLDELQTLLKYKAMGKALFPHQIDALIRASWFQALVDSDFVDYADDHYENSLITIFDIFPRLRSDMDIIAAIGKTMCRLFHNFPEQFLENIGYLLINTNRRLIEKSDHSWKKYFDTYEWNWIEYQLRLRLSAVLQQRLYEQPFETAAVKMDEIILTADEMSLLEDFLRVFPLDYSDAMLNYLLEHKTIQLLTSYTTWTQMETKNPQIKELSVGFWGWMEMSRHQQISWSPEFVQECRKYNRRDGTMKPLLKLRVSNEMTKTNRYKYDITPILKNGFLNAMAWYEERKYFNNFQLLAKQRLSVLDEHSFAYQHVADQLAEYDKQQKREREVLVLDKKVHEDEKQHQEEKARKLEAYRAKVVQERLRYLAAQSEAMRRFQQQPNENVDQKELPPLHARVLQQPQQQVVNQGALANVGFAPPHGGGSYRPVTGVKITTRKF